MSQEYEDTTVTYENATVSIDEKLGIISVHNHENKYIGMYFIKSEEDQEDLKDLPLSRSINFTFTCLTCLAFPMAYLGIVSSCHNLNLVGTMSILAGNIVAAIIVFFFLPGLIALIAYEFNFSKFIKEDKRLILALIIIIIWCILFIAIPKLDM